VRASRCARETAPGRWHDPALLAASLAVVAFLAMPAHAGGRPGGGFGSWFPHFYGGWAAFQGDAQNIVDDDFILGGGATFWPSDWPLGLEFDLRWGDFDIGNDILRRINDVIESDPDNEGSVTGGDFRVWRVGVNAIYSIGDRSSSGLYLKGGVGVGFVEGRLFSQGLVYYPPVCDPWFWWCIPGGVGPGTFVSASEEQTQLSLNVGVGYSFDTGTGGQVYVEAAYETIFTENENTSYIPLTVGYRF
jgi:hypothetical protein